jgi:hypothetical protein
MSIANFRLSTTLVRVNFNQRFYGHNHTCILTRYGTLFDKIYAIVRIKRNRIGSPEQG